MKNFEKYFGKVIYFLGIGGVSVSALAKLSHSLGAIVLGSDEKSSRYTQSLSRLGIKVHIGHAIEHISKDIDYLVYTSAIPPSNVELARARDLGIPCIERGHFLSEILGCYSKVIAVAGTHGKTTTTALISHILSFSGFSPSMHLGGVSVNSGDNVLLGSSGIMVSEACEYRDAFHDISSSIAVVTNIEKEHMDYFTSMEDVFRSYSHFVSNADTLVVWQGEYTARLRCKRLFTCGITSECDYMVANITRCDMGYTFDIFRSGSLMGKFRCNLIGLHNVYNATLAIAVLDIMGVDIPHIYMGLLTFRGVERRYEYVGSIHDTPVIIDYAHHPTEIRSSIEGVREHYKRVLCVFQPHTFSRTKTLINDFRSCFMGAKHLVIYKTYHAREQSIVGGRAKDLFAVVSNHSKHYVSSKKTLRDYLHSLDLGLYDVVLVLGAGDIDKVIRFCLK